MAIAKMGQTRPLKPLVLEFFGAVIKKGDFPQEGQHLCLVQERKAENEECF
jgi:hypothetical protein